MVTVIDLQPKKREGCWGLADQKPIAGINSFIASGNSACEVERSPPRSADPTPLPL